MAKVYGKSTGRPLKIEEVQEDGLPWSTGSVTPTPVVP